MSRFTNGQPRLQFSTLTIGILLGILMLTFSSGVYAARKSSPNQFLYPVKLWLEDSRMAFTSSPHEQLDLRLEYAEERLNEIEDFSGKLTDPTLQSTLQNFDEQFSAIQALSGEQELDDVQQERIEKIQVQYQSIHEGDEDDKDSSNETDERDESDSNDGLEDKPKDIEPADPEDPNDNTPEDENNLTETPDDGDDEKSPEETESSDDKSPEKTQEPDDDSEDKPDDNEEDSTPKPDPTPDEEDSEKESNN